MRRSTKTISVADAPAEAAAQSPYAHDPDVQLMLRVAGGDDGAFAELVDAYQARLIGIFSHLLGDPEAAEDLAQEAFLRVYRARRGYQPTAKFSTWLFHIANNLASNVRRDKGRKKEVSLSTGEADPLDPRPEEHLIADKSGLLPARVLARQETQELVRRALDQLNDRQRMALLLHKFEGMSYADIAETMNLTTMAVKALLARARENLRTLLEHVVK